MNKAVMGFMLLLSGGAVAEELILRGSDIKAMEGLPTVSFVVPWQASQPSPYISMAPYTVLDDYMQLLDTSLLSRATQQPEGDAYAPPVVKQP